MEKKLWVRADQDNEWDDRKKIITTALESGADAVIVKKGEAGKVTQLGKILVVSEDDKADIRLVRDLKDLSKFKGKKAFYKEINCKEDEEEIVRAGKGADYVIVNAKNWKVIPLENLIAGLGDKSEIIVEVSTIDDARLALETLEIGSEGVLVDAGLNEIKKISELIDQVSTQKLDLKTAKITKVAPVGMGDRVCVDTCSIFNVGEGMVVGSQSNSLFLVHSETIETPYVAPRPVRVNAGPVHAYTRMPDGKTRYLSELNAGDEVLGVDFEGNTRRMIVGRVKVEKRPLILVEAQSGDRKIKTLLQNAETIRLVTVDGKPLSVANLKEGDEVLVYLEDSGRHFGMKVDESIEEK